MHSVVIDKTEPAYQELLGRPIRELGLKLAGSPVERFVEQLYRELEAKGLTKFRPEVYLTDEWGCPSGEPIIGIPFYLANAELSLLEKQAHDLLEAWGFTYKSQIIWDKMHLGTAIGSAISTRFC